MALCLPLVRLCKNGVSCAESFDLHVVSIVNAQLHTMLKRVKGRHRRPLSDSLARAGEAQLSRSTPNDTVLPRAL
jgi:hypothetical protein